MTDDPKVTVAPAATKLSTTKVEGDKVIVETPIVNLKAQPQPSAALSEEQKAIQAKFADTAPVVAKVIEVTPPPEVRVEVPVGMEHLADDKTQIAYATVNVSDKTIPQAAIAEPLGSRRLADEQAAGKASLVRKHSPDQVARENATGQAAAARAAAQLTGQKFDAAGRPITP